jgi:hypothetical protein
MKTRVQKGWMVGTIVVAAGALGVPYSFGGDQNQPSEFGRTGNQGEGFKQEQTIKGKGQAPESTIQQDTQISLGGARPVVEGAILKIQGEQYLIQDVSGSQALVRVNKDTDMACGTGSGQGGTVSTGRQTDEQREIAPTAHMGEHQGKSKESHQGKQPSRERIGDQSGTQSRSALGKDSGGDLAQGSGFTVGPKGGCTFKVGDRVRAEVSDLGTVLYIRPLTERDTGSQQAMSGQMIEPEGQMTPGQRAAAQQQAQMMKPGSVPAPGDLQNPDVITGGPQTAKADPRPKELCEKCHLIRGMVLRVNPDGFVVKEAAAGKEVNLKVNQQTQMGQISNPRAGTFVEGDRIEAYVHPDGTAWSITALKQQQGQPGIMGAPGD